MKTMNTIKYLVIASIIGLLAGCVSSALPPRLTATQSKRLSELPLPYSVGVVTYKHPIYSYNLTAALKDSGAFVRVAPIGDFTRPPDLIARVEKSVYGTPVIPLVTMATGGVVPLVFDEEHGFVFSLAPSSGRTQKTVINASYSGKSTLGLASTAINVSPAYTRGDPHKSERFRQMLAYRILNALRPKKVGVPHR